jgi:hypothetical protein
VSASCLVHTPVLLVEHNLRGNRQGQWFVSFGPHCVQALGPEYVRSSTSDLIQDNDATEVETHSLIVPDPKTPSN